MSKKALIDLRRKDLAMVFQSFALLPHLSVLRNTAFGLEVAGVDRKTREMRAMEVLDQVGLKAFANRMPAELSGGMQQRVGLARALAVDPSLMLMDEAFSALDPLKRTEMQELLLKLQAEQQRTIVFVSHDLDEAFHIGNRIAIMEGGRIVQIGTPDEILAQPQRRLCACLLQGRGCEQIPGRQGRGQHHGNPGDTPRQAMPRPICTAPLPACAKPSATTPLWWAMTAACKARSRWIRCTAAWRRKAQHLSAAYLPQSEPVADSVVLRDLIGRLVKNPVPLPVVDADQPLSGRCDPNDFVEKDGGRSGG